MSSTQAQPGQIVQLSLGNGLHNAHTATLVKTADWQLVRAVILAGQHLPTHTAPGDVILQCLEGRIALTIGERSLELQAGQLIYLAPGESHALTGLEDSTLLLTILSVRSQPDQEFDLVQEASEESFPASDPPARTPMTRP